MTGTKIKTAPEAAAMVKDGATIAVSSSSGLGCPDAVLAALGARFAAEGHPRGLTSVHPIAAGDMFGIKGVDHLAQDGMLARIIGGSYPSGPTNAAPPLIWQLILSEAVAAWNVPSGILFDMLREGAGLRPGVLTKVGMDTFADPAQDGWSRRWPGHWRPGRQNWPRDWPPSATSANRISTREATHDPAYGALAVH